MLPQLKSGEVRSDQGRICSDPLFNYLFNPSNYTVHFAQVERGRDAQPSHLFPEGLLIEEGGKSTFVSTSGLPARPASYSLCLIPGALHLC